MNGKQGNLTNTFRKVPKTGIKFPFLFLIKRFIGVCMQSESIFPASSMQRDMRFP